MDIDEATIRELAQAIWDVEGRPEGQEVRHWEMATRLAESAAMAPRRTASAARIDPLFPEPPPEPDSQCDSDVTEEPHS